MPYMNNDPLASDLPRPIAREGNYVLRKVDGVLTVYIDYTDHEEFGDRRKRACFVGTMVHEENFSTVVDDLNEEMRIEMAEFL